MKKTIYNFIKCGVLGWCLEIGFTSLDQLRRRNKTLKGITSIWMFPIYGMACLLVPIYTVIRSLHWFLRGLIYMVLIFGAEYTSGRLLQKYDLCPWDYSKDACNIHGVIRLDYAPFWFIKGLLFEKLLFSRKDVS